MMEAHIPQYNCYSSARLHNVIYKDDSHHHSQCHQKLKFIQITMTIYVREAQDLFVHIQMETVICNCPEENRSNSHEKQPHVDEVSEDSILTCVWE